MSARSERRALERQFRLGPIADEDRNTSPVLVAALCSAPAGAGTAVATAPAPALRPVMMTSVVTLPSRPVAGSPAKPSRPSTPSGGHSGRRLAWLIVLLAVATGFVVSFLGSLGSKPSPTVVHKPAPITSVDVPHIVQQPIIPAAAPQPVIHRHVAILPTHPIRAHKAIVHQVAAPARQSVAVTHSAVNSVHRPTTVARPGSGSTTGGSSGTGGGVSAPPVRPVPPPVAVKTPVHVPAPPATQPKQPVPPANDAYTGPKNAGDGTNAVSVVNSDQTAGGGSNTDGATPTGTGNDVNTITATQTF